MNKCKCTLAQSIVGDGCRICQPEKYMAILEISLAESDKRIEELEEEIQDRAYTEASLARDLYDAIECINELKNQFQCHDASTGDLK